MGAEDYKNTNKITNLNLMGLAKLVHSRDLFKVK